MIRPFATLRLCALASAVLRASASALALVLPFVPVAASAQAAPATPVPSAVPPSPAPSAAPNPIGPALFANDPCTSLSAIVTRPTVTNSVCTVRPDHVLVETGYQNTSADGGGNAVVAPQTLIRVGTRVRGLELDVVPPEYERVRAGGVAVSGSTDVGAGLKYVLGATPKLVYGAQALFTAPTGLGASNGGSTSNVAVNASYTLSPALSLAATAASASLVSGGTRYASFIPSLVLSATLPSATGAYAEIARFSNAAGPGTPTRTQYIGGLLHDVGTRLQVDVEYGYSPTAATGTYRYVGAGLSYYF